MEFEFLPLLDPTSQAGAGPSPPHSAQGCEASLTLKVRSMSFLWFNMLLTQQPTSAGVHVRHAFETYARHIVWELPTSVPYAPHLDSSVTPWGH